MLVSSPGKLNGDGSPHPPCGGVVSGDPLHLIAVHSVPEMIRDVFQVTRPQAERLRHLQRRQSCTGGWQSPARFLEPPREQFVAKEISRAEHATASLVVVESVLATEISPHDEEHLSDWIPFVYDLRFGRKISIQSCIVPQIGIMSDILGVSIP